MITHFSYIFASVLNKNTFKNDKIFKTISRSHNHDVPQTNFGLSGTSSHPIFMRFPVESETARVGVEAAARSMMGLLA